MRVRTAWLGIVLCVVSTSVARAQESPKNLKKHRVATEAAIVPWNAGTSLFKSLVLPVNVYPSTVVQQLSVGGEPVGIWLVFLSKQDDVTVSIPANPGADLQVCQARVGGLSQLPPVSVRLGFSSERTLAWSNAYAYHEDETCSATTSLRNAPDSDTRASLRISHSYGNEYFVLVADKGLAAAPYPQELKVAAGLIGQRLDAGSTVPEAVLSAPAAQSPPQEPAQPRRHVPAAPPPVPQAAPRQGTDSTAAILAALAVMGALIAAAWYRDRRRARGATGQLVRTGDPDMQTPNADAAAVARAERESDRKIGNALAALAAMSNPSLAALEAIVAPLNDAERLVLQHRYHQLQDLHRATMPPEQQSRPDTFEEFMRTHGGI